MILSRLQVGIGVAVTSLIGCGFVWQIRERTKLRTDAAHQTAAVAKLAALKGQVAAETARAAAAETSIDTALKAAKVAYADLAVVSPPSFVIDTEALLNATLAKARQAISEEKPPAALDEYLSCYRQLQNIRPGSVECQTLMHALVHLGRTYPPALAALATLRDAAMAQLQAEPGRPGLPFEIALLNERLGEGHRTLALYDWLPASDHAGRQTLAHLAQRSFVAARRYSDALLGNSFGRMLSQLEVEAQHRAPGAALGDIPFVNIEILTGAGHLDEARILTEKLLAFDRSDTTRAKLKRHLDRAQAPKP